jgi:hypothetical protein
LIRDFFKINSLEAIRQGRHTSFVFYLFYFKNKNKTLESDLEKSLPTLPTLPNQTFSYIELRLYDF